MLLELQPAGIHNFLIAGISRPRCEQKDEKSRQDLRQPSAIYFFSFFHFYAVIHTFRSFSHTQTIPAQLLDLRLNYLIFPVHPQTKELLT
jgi:hypothetical protein